MDQITKIYKSLSVAQRWSLLVGALLTAAAFAWFTHFEREAGFRPLFASLSSEDASAIIQKLKEKGIDYRIGPNGTSVMVPEQQVAELRLDMAGAGLPKTGRIGYEIFDKTNFGITDFAEHVNYRRAVEGELERSVMSIAEVEQARVHVTFPKDSVFLDSREAAKASVLVRLAPGAALSAQNVAAITHLVSSAVEGLTPTAVSVVDMQGNLLNRPHHSGPNDGLSDEALEYQQKVEHELQAKIASTLEPLLGPDKFRTALSVDCDMSAGEQSEEVFDPSKSVMVTSQRTEDAPGSTAIASGQPGTASNLPHPPTSEPRSASGPARRVENITYESSRTTRHVKLAQGTIKRLSIAVLLDQNVEWNGKQRTLVPPTPEKIKTIHDLVATAVGLVPERGDQLAVETLPFDSTLNSPAPVPYHAPIVKKEKKTFIQEKVESNPMMVYGGAAAAAIVVLLVGFKLMRRGGSKSRAEYPAALEAAAPAHDQVNLTHSAAAHSETPASSQTLQLPPPRVEVITGQLKESVTRDAELWAGVLRAWLAEEENA